MRAPVISALGSWVPPRAALQAATALTVPLVAVLAACARYGGEDLVLGAFLGAVAGLPGSLTAVTRGVRAAVVALGTGAAAAGVAAADQPWAVAAVLAALGVAQYPLTRVAAGSGALLLVVPAVAASVAGGGDARVVGLGALIGTLSVLAVGRLLGPGAPAVPVARDVAARHAVAVAVAVTACTPAVTADFGHGYWIVLTVAALLRPVPGESTRLAGRRVAGAVVGIALAAGVVLLFPPAVAVVFALLCAWGQVAWTLARDEFRQATLGTPVVILVASSSPAGSQVAASVERLLWVGAGAAVAVAAALVLAVFDERDVSAADAGSAAGRGPRSDG